MKGYIDNLTKLHNMLYLHENYSKFISGKDCNVVSIDFQNLKYINDNFGHDAGDKSLIIFAKILKEVFLNSLLIRRSGDEFIIITSEVENVLVENLYFIKNKIIEAQKKGVIPIAFSFNSGIKKAEINLKETLYKADITMYDAKNKKRLISFYNELILLDVKNKKRFTKKIDRLLITKDFNYEYQKVYNLLGKETNLNQLYLRDDENNSIFSGEKFHILKTNFRLKKIDFANLEVLFSKYLFNLKEKVIINIHYDSLLSKEINFTNYIKELSKKYNVNLKNIVLMVNIVGYDGEILVLVQKLIELRRLGISLGIDKLTFTNNDCLLSLLTMLEIDFVNISRQSVLKAMKEDRFKVLFFYLITMFKSFKTIPLFINLEKDEEVEFLKKLSPKYLGRGFIFSKPKPIKKMFD